MGILHSEPSTSRRPSEPTHTPPSHLTQTDILLRMTQTLPTDTTRAYTCLRTKKDCTPQNQNGTLSSTEHGGKNMRSNMCNTPSDTTQTHTHQPNTEAHSSDSTWGPTRLRTNADNYSLYQKRARTAQNTTRKQPARPTWTQTPRTQREHTPVRPTMDTHTHSEPRQTNHQNPTQEQTLHNRLNP